MNLPYRPFVWLVNDPQPLVDGARHGPLTLEAEPLPVGRHPRGRLWAVAVFFAPIFVFAVELGGRDLRVRAPNTSVVDKECRHVVVLPELFGGILDAGGNLEVATLLETPQSFERPVEYPGALGFDGTFDLRVALILGQRREGDDLDTPEESRVGVCYSRQLVHSPTHFGARRHGERVTILALDLDRLTRDDGVQRVGRGEIRRRLLARHHERLAGQVRQCKPAALEVSKAEDPGTVAEHGLKTGDKRTLAAPRRAEQPNGELVSHLGSESVARKLLQEVDCSRRRAL